MLFTSKALATLEYDKIIDMLCELCSTDGAKARARALMPTDDYETVVTRQMRTEDAKRLINAKGYPPFISGLSGFAAQRASYPKSPIVIAR